VNDVASFEDYRPDDDEMLSEALEGLLSMPKTLPSKYLYDEKGSDLFQQICQLPEYYPTRTETHLLQSIAGEIAELIGPECQMIEYGSGSSEKMHIVLRALIEPESFTAVDISKEHLLSVTKALSKEFPLLKVHAVSADFVHPFSVPEMIGDGLRVGFFPGSTIGNFTYDGAINFLQGTREVVGLSGAMLVGLDLKKDERILHAAYNDAQGVTAAFNMNLLARMNSELGATFNLNEFCHEAFYNAEIGRIEMHLKSLSDQTVRLGPEVISFDKNETIHTENSYKYRLDEFTELAERAGYKTLKSWCDPDNLFGISFLQGAS
jgi:dimethylhistidine N-methyltransferase